MASRKETSPPATLDAKEGAGRHMGRERAAGELPVKLWVHQGGEVGMMSSSREWTPTGNGVPVTDGV